MLKKTRTIWTSQTSTSDSEPPGFCLFIEQLGTATQVSSNAVTDNIQPSFSLDQRPVRKVFTDRRGGSSSGEFKSFNLGDHVGDAPEAVAANRRKLATAIGLSPSDLVFMEQIHSANVTEVTADSIATARVEQGIDAADPAIMEFSDALVTRQRRTALVVLTADCVPVLLSDTEAGVIAAVHAGRLGARNGILRATVEKMIELGAHAGDIHALFGAAASGARYEVPAHMAADVEAHLPGSRTRTAQGTDGLDLRAGLVRQIMEMGVRNVNVDPRCTIDTLEFFSYRREGKTGRQAGVVWLP